VKYGEMMMHKNLMTSEDSIHRNHLSTIDAIAFNYGLPMRHSFVVEVVVVAVVVLSWWLPFNLLPPLWVTRMMGVTKSL